MEAGIWTIWDRNPTSNKLKQTNMYKVGDRVKIRSDLKKRSGCDELSITIDMLDHKGSHTTITEIHTNYYNVAIDAGFWCWTPEMFENNPSNKLFKLM